MPAAYESMRNRFYQEKLKAWKAKHPGKSLSDKAREVLYHSAQKKAARIYNSRNPENPVGRGS